MPSAIREANLAQEGENASSDPVKGAYRRVAELELEAFLAAEGRLSFPRPEQPRLTIVLVVYNNPALTYRCLASLAREADSAVEVLVVDNASGSETQALLDRIDGARVVRHRENLHFLEGVNSVLPEVRGAYVLLLNNDVVLFPGALRRALETAESNPSLGAVGGQVVGVDGYLIEAGCEILGHGDCHGLRSGQPPESGRLASPEAVDYVSGCFLLTPWARLQEVGGLDRRYAPAYYEDVDYCTELWERGWGVVCDPGVVVLHYESAGSSRYEIADKVLRNRRVFLEKHEWRSAHQARQGAHNKAGGPSP